MSSSDILIQTEMERYAVLLHQNAGTAVFVAVLTEFVDSVYAYMSVYVQVWCSEASA